jgi:hypothetical protein
VVGRKSETMGVNFKKKKKQSNIKPIV